MRLGTTISLAIQGYTCLAITVCTCVREQAMITPQVQQKEMAIHASGRVRRPEAFAQAVSRHCVYRGRPEYNNNSAR